MALGAGRARGPVWRPPTPPPRFLLRVATPVVRAAPLLLPPGMCHRCSGSDLTLLPEALRCPCPRLPLPPPPPPPPPLPLRTALWPRPQEPTVAGPGRGPGVPKASCWSPIPSTAAAVARPAPSSRPAAPKAAARAVAGANARGPGRRGRGRTATPPLPALSVGLAAPQLSRGPRRPRAASRQGPGVPRPGRQDGQAPLRRRKAPPSQLALLPATPRAQDSGQREKPVAAAAVAGERGELSSSGGPVAQLSGVGSMSDQERIQECLRKEIRSLLISTKDGLTPQQLEREYLSMVGNHLPLRILGYRSTMELVLDMPDVVSVCPCGDGTVILKAIPDETTKGIASLVAKQRSSNKLRNSTQKGRANVGSSSGSRRRLPYRGRIPPILPAVVKSELRDLLAFSPILLSDFEKAFAKRFGRSFQYMQYGFLSMFEVLSAASDIIAVEQTRAGSLLTLKRNLPSEQKRGLPAGKTSQVGTKQPKSSMSAPIVRTYLPEPASTTEPLKQPHPVKTTELNGMETSSLDQSEKLNQLENTFKSVIAQIGPGGTINSELKKKIKFVASKFPQGLLISKLLGEFEAVFKEPLSPKRLGFLNVAELVGSLSDILHVEFREGEQDLLVFDAEMKHLTTDKKIEDQASMSSPPRNSLSSADIKDTSWNYSVEKHRDTEEKVCKKFNLVTKPVPLHMGMKQSQLNLEMSGYEIPPDAVQNRKLCSLPPLDSSTLVGVFVEYIISPSQFYIRIYSRDSSELLEDMMIEMRRCYSNQLVSDRYIMPESFIQPGHLCCVRISEDKWWYRVIIHRVLGKQEVEVFYPDFGNLGTVQKSSLRFLKCCYIKLPAQAIPCSLAWVRPIEEHWTPQAILQFQKLCGLKPLVGVVDEYVDGVLNLFLCDTSSNEDIYFHHVLRAEGYAIVCRENVPSKRGAGDRTSVSYLEPEAEMLFLGSDIGSPEAQDEDCQESQELEYPIEMPYLESVSIGDDVWDENWLPLQSDREKRNGNAALLFTSGRKQCQPCQESLQKEWCSAAEELWNAAWQHSESENDMKIELKTSEFQEQDAQETITDIAKNHKDNDLWMGKDRTKMANRELIPKISKEIIKQRLAALDEFKTPGRNKLHPQQLNLEDSSDSSTLSKSLEDFYISLIHSQQSAELNHSEPGRVQTLPKQIQLSTAALTCNLLPTVVDSQEKHTGLKEIAPENMKNEDFSGNHALTMFKDSTCAQGSMEQISFILSPEHSVSQKLFIPRSTATAALGAAARLAMSSSLLHWYPRLRRMEA
ncbi:tudor domain-containing protein 5 isoform X2 [Sminthopsis crassicaudata]|uniref:tudor domain-containing protein 5 isoform X2 n=1 Tax=Sminthopsis crassicaudata TaxID=9301 RepID=UPI003D686BCF